MKLKILIFLTVAIFLVAGTLYASRSRMGLGMSLSMNSGPTVSTNGAYLLFGTDNITFGTDKLTF
jgi:hypothetical protein